MKKQFGFPIIYNKYGKAIYAKTQGQHELIEAIDKYDILFVNGSSGTGKTFLSICKAIKGLIDNKYERLIVTRPAIESGEELGFLPGNLDDKIKPFMRPIFDSISELKSKSNEHKNGNGKKKKNKTTPVDNDWDKKIEILPLAYMRGTTLNDSFIIMDECQNVTMSQMKLFLTRFGMGSKAILIGDLTQSDLKRNIRSGFSHAQTLLKNVKDIGVVNLTEDDIVRHKIIKDIILCYEKETYKNRVLSNKC